MKYLLLVAFVIYITIANAKPSQTSGENLNGDKTLLESESERARIKRKSSNTPKIYRNGNATRAHNIFVHAVNLFAGTTFSLVSQCATETWEESKSTLERSFRARFPQCDDIVIEAILQDVLGQMEGTEPCFDPVVPMHKVFKEMAVKAAQHCQFFWFGHYETANAVEINKRLQDMEEMEILVEAYQNYNFESEERDLKECFKNFIEKAKDRWDEIEIPVDQCETDFFNHEVARN